MLSSMLMEISSADHETCISSPTSSSSRIPRRLRDRLSESKTPSPTAEDIEAKLRSADLRRQKFYENLSCKARPKRKDWTQNSSQDEDLGQRLEAKLHAAAQKRMDILANAQMRLARLDELRQAAKTDVEIRSRKEREIIFSRVASRFQQAEANRLLILKAYSQKRATIKERTSQSLLRRMVHESKYKERVRTAIHQRRAAAEKKRLGLIEAERERACARLLQVQKIAKLVLHRREIERRKIKDQLEDRLQRAKRQRAKYLKARKGLHNYLKYNSCLKVHSEYDAASKKISRCWTHFQKVKRTTYNIAKTYDALNINWNTVCCIPFEQLAALIESTATLQTVKVLLDRLETRYRLSHASSSRFNLGASDEIDHLLKKVVTPSRKSTPRSYRMAGANKQSHGRVADRNSATLSRYQARIFLCAYMILGHPDAVFSGQGELEIALAKSSESFVQEFEALMKIILQGSIRQTTHTEHDRTLKCTFRAQLLAFDRVWCSYLNCFVAWKVKDAKLLEDDLVRAACQLELSMIQTCKLTPEGENGAMTHDMLAVKKQVMGDQQLLRERIQRLSGDAGIQHMDCALSDTRAKYFQTIESRNSLGSQAQHLLSVTHKQSADAVSSVSRTCEKGNFTENVKKPNRVARALFQGDSSVAGEMLDWKTSPNDCFSCIDAKITMENEMIVNELVHNQHQCLVDNCNSLEQSGIKAKVRETMKKAFWDGVIGSMEQSLPSYDRIIELVKEMRDGICEIAPENWKEEIFDAIDLDIFSQMLKQGELDLDYFGKLLVFALTTLQKLCASAYDEKMKNDHEQFLKDISEMCRSGDKSRHSHTIAMVKGLRFILEDIQALKQEISKARIRMIEPVLKGPSALDYLRTAFENRYGCPNDASTSLPLTMQWLSSVRGSKDEQWSEYRESLSALSSLQSFLPRSPLKTGHSGVLLSSSGAAAANTPGNCERECKGDTVDLMVRLGLVKLVSGVSGQTMETLPETFKLNLSRIRGVQAQYQKIIVTCTSALICWQMLLSEQFVGVKQDMEGIVLKSTKKLTELLDRVDDAGIKEIVEVISEACTDGGDKIESSEKNRLRKELLARMLAKSLSEGDTVFERVSGAVYVAMRAAVLAGNGVQGRALAETALGQVRAGSMVENLMQAAEILVVVGTVSTAVHGPWYANIINL